MTYTGWQAAIIYVLGLSSPPGLTTTSPFLLSPAGFPNKIRCKNVRRRLVKDSRELAHSLQIAWGSVL